MKKVKVKGKVKVEIGEKMRKMRKMRKRRKVNDIDNHKIQHSKK